MATGLDEFEPSKAGKYDPGQIVILFDGRQNKSPDEKYSIFQYYWMESMIKLGWPSVHAQDLEPGKLRLIWYSHAGNEGTRDYPLWQAYTVKEMFDSLSEQLFRPMILGWSGENPFPMIGGSEPPSKPKKLVPRTVTSTSATVSGHSGVKGNPHDRVMAIIDAEEEREAKKRKELVERASRLQHAQEDAGLV
nr:hypothetical protein CFP56_10992 [Quercus suber]